MLKQIHAYDVKSAPLPIDPVYIRFKGGGGHFSSIVKK